MPIEDALGATAFLPSCGALGHRFVRDGRNAVAPSGRFLSVGTYQSGFQAP